MSRFHLKEYPDYKYQPRKRPAVTAAVGHDTSAGTRPHRRPAVKRLAHVKRANSRKKRSAKLVPRCHTPLSTADSELSELAESYLSSDWSIDDDDFDLDVTGSGNPPTYTTTLESDAQPCRPHITTIESLSLCGRSFGGLKAFDWMEDYVTPEVIDLLADDWLVAADNICLSRDVVVM